MITDPLTARVLGLLVLVLAMLVDVSCVLFSRPETRQNPRFALVVVVSSLPMYLAGGLLLRKASRMGKDEDEDNDG